MAVGAVGGSNPTDWSSLTEAQLNAEQRQEYQAVIADFALNMVMDPTEIINDDFGSSS